MKPTAELEKKNASSETVSSVLAYMLRSHRNRVSVAPNWAERSLEVEDDQSLYIPYFSKHLP